MFQTVFAILKQTIMAELGTLVCGQWSPHIASPFQLHPVLVVARAPPSSPGSSSRSSHGSTDLVSRRQTKKKKQLPSKGSEGRAVCPATRTASDRSARTSPSNLALNIKPVFEDTAQPSELDILQSVDDVLDIGYVDKL